MNGYLPLVKDWGFLLYYPLKQGLKPWAGWAFPGAIDVFTLLSIKTRIETEIYPAWT